RVERLQSDDRGAGADILTDIDSAHAEVARKWRPQGLFGDDGFLLGDLSFGVLQVCGISVERRLAHRPDLELLLVALLDDSARSGGGLKRFELGNIIVGAQRQKDVAGSNVVSGFEMQLLGDPGHLEREVGAVDGAKASDRLDLRLPFLY